MSHIDELIASGALPREVGGPATYVGWPGEIGEQARVAVAAEEALVASAQSESRARELFARMRPGRWGKPKLTAEEREARALEEYQQRVEAIR